MEIGQQEPPARLPVPYGPGAFDNVTFVDRRQCKRVVPMRVMCFGPSRTGTSSLRQALVDLGYSHCYHYVSIFQENLPDAEMWVQAFEAKFEGKGNFGKEQWDQLLGHCQALTDTPCTVFYRELLEAYPDAKVILTVRDSPRQWWESIMRTVVPFFDLFNQPPQTWSMWLWRQFLPPPTAFNRMNDLLYKHYTAYDILCKDMRHGTEHGIKWYEEYMAEIQRLVPKEKLLIMNIKEGWKPLCDFLGDEIPAWNFPCVNTTDDWQQNVTGFYQMINQAVLINAAKTIGPVVAGTAAVAAGLYYYGGVF